MKNEEESKLKKDFIDATKAATICGAVRALLLTPGIEVPCTNIERTRQIFLQQNNKWPSTGYSLLIKMYKENKLKDLHTGIGSNVTKNFTREFVKSYIWLGVPLVVPYIMPQDFLKKNPSATQIATVASIIGGNATMNAIFDGIRNKQIDTFNFTGKKLTMGQSAKEIIASHGPFGFFYGGSITYLYSLVFWGTFASSREVYSGMARRFGLKPDCDISVQTGVNIACGITAGVVTMPIEHIRYGVLGGSLPSKIMPAFKQFHKAHASTIGLKTYFLGLPQSLPIQISAAILAGTLLYFQNKSKKSQSVQR